MKASRCVQALSDSGETRESQTLQSKDEHGGHMGEQTAEQTIRRLKDGDNKERNAPPKKNYARRDMEYGQEKFNVISLESLNKYST